MKTCEQLYNFYNKLTMYRRLYETDVYIRLDESEPILDIICQ